jgi:SulP family sulfate permease
MLLLAPYAKLIPLSCLAGILVVVAYHMSEWRQFISILKGHKTDVIILLTTFLLTVIFDLIIAIEIGIILSSFMFMKRMSEAVQIINISSEKNYNEQLFEDELKGISKDILVYEINGPLFFGAARQFQETILNNQTDIKVLILRMRYVPMIDATGFQSLKAIISSFKNKGILIVLSGISVDLRKSLRNNGIYNLVERKYLVKDIQKAIAKSNDYLNSIKNSY